MDICVTLEQRGKDVKPWMSEKEFGLNRSVMYSGANPHNVM